MDKELATIEAYLQEHVVLVACKRLVRYVLVPAIDEFTKNATDSLNMNILNGVTRGTNTLTTLVMTTTFIFVALALLIYRNFRDERQIVVRILGLMPVELVYNNIHLRNYLARESREF